MKMLRQPDLSRDVIRDLARRTRRPEEEVGRVFEEQIALLRYQARVTIYLPILAQRRTREWLRRH